MSVLEIILYVIIGALALWMIIDTILDIVKPERAEKRKKKKQENKAKKKVI